MLSFKRFLFFVSLIGFSLSPVLTTQAAELPAIGVFIHKNGNGKPIDSIELAADGSAFTRYSSEVRRARATVIGQSVHVVFKPTNLHTKQVKLILTPKQGSYIDQYERLWLPKSKVLKANPNWTDFSIKVTWENGDLLKDFSYTYFIETKSGTWNPLLVRPISANGTLSIKAPLNADIRLYINHPDMIRGFGSGSDVQRLKGTKNATTIIRKGQTIEGTIIDKETRKPLAQAKVSPDIFTPPSFSPDHSRTVITKANGRFSIRGVDSSFTVEHKNYKTESVYINEKDPSKHHTVNLDPGAIVKGVILNQHNKPLAGVRVDDGAGKTSLSDKNGSFELRGLGKWADSGKKWHFNFEKKGYNEKTVYLKTLGPNGLKITLHALPRFSGKVVDNNGQPISNFRILCGPGKAPMRFECNDTQISAADGSFDFIAKQLPEKGNHYWLAVHAENYAPKEIILSSARLQQGDLLVTLNKGYSVSGIVKSSKPAQLIHIQIKPTDRPNPHEYIVSEHPGKPLASQNITTKTGTTFMLPHLRKGTYLLKIHGPRLTPVTQNLTITDKNLQLGDIEVSGTGSIVGLIHHPHAPEKPWRFADGQILVAGMQESDPAAAGLRFKTDANGKFSVKGVPTGEVIVYFQYHQTADIIGSSARYATVIANKKTEIRFNDPGASWAQIINLTFNKQSTPPPYLTEKTIMAPPSLRMVVSPVDHQPSSWPGEIIWRRGDALQPVIPDLSPGTWNIRVYDWLGSAGFDDGFLTETTFTTDPERKPVAIDLAVNAFKGKIITPREFRRYPRIIAYHHQAKRCYYSRCNTKGEFLIRYLPKGSYELYAHDDDGGWCHLGRHQTATDVPDIGSHTLAIGGHIQGKLGTLPLPGEEMEITATHEDGHSIPLDTLNADGTFTFGNLKPGKWRITIKLKNKIISTQSATVIHLKTTILSQL